MADTAGVDVAFEGRPGTAEVAAVLTACALMFAVLVHFDGAAARSEASRARQALADRAAAARAPAEPKQWRRRGDDSIGNAGPISVPVFSAWGAGTSASVGHAKPAPAEPPLRRVTGPVAAPVVSARPAAVPAAVAADGPPSALLALLGGLGAAMALGGSALIARGRR